MRKFSVKDEEIQLYDELLLEVMMMQNEKN